MTDVPGDLRPELKTAAAHWSAISARKPAAAQNWWQSPQIIAHVNRIICGEPVPGMAGGDVAALKAVTGAEPLRDGVSVGCGNAMKEIALLHSGVVDHFTLFEISDVRIGQGKAHAESLGVESRITWRAEEADFSDPFDVDLVYWQNALHHMPDTAAAIHWSRRSLRPGGVFYANDYVGPDRLQWTEEMLDAAEEIRRSLPPHIIGELPLRPERPDAAALAADDPTESADSAAILPALQRELPGVTIKPTGGVIYHLALKGLIERFGEGDEEIMGRLLAEDERLAQDWLTHYAVAVWKAESR